MRAISLFLFLAGFLSLFTGSACACQITASSSFQNLITTVLWIGGTGLCIAALFKFRAARKQAKDGRWNQTCKRQGWIRLVFGIMMIGFPFLQAAMQGTIYTPPVTPLNARPLTIDELPPEDRKLLEVK